jgi:predicted nuclease with TOPRIM domain
MNVKEINNYYAEAREKWGNTSEYKEYEAKSKNRTKQEFEDINDRFMNIFSEIGKLKDLSVEDEKVQGKIKELQQFISENYYTCTNEILYSLGQMYVNDERFKNNIDRVAGESTAKFVSEAISVYCSK